jgi:hypothetical protein
MLTVLIAGGLGVAVLVFALYQYQHYKRLYQSGIEVDGVVFDQTMATSATNTERYPIVRFVTKNNQWITAQANVSIPGFFKTGQKVTVVYDPRDPNNFMIKSRIVRMIPIVLACLGIIVLAIAVVQFLELQTS